MISRGKRLIVVLGMHRSGTSTITRALNVLGVALGDRLMPPIDGNNAKGFFEDIDLNALNIEMLQALGSDWHCLAPIESGDVENLHKKGFFLRAVALLRQKTADVPIFGFKDPRVAKLLPFWHPVFVHCGFDIGYIIVIRNPLSVVQSLAKRDGFRPEKSYMLWLGHELTSLLHTEGQRRAMVDYDHFLHASQQDLELIADRLALQLNPHALHQYQSEFLDEGLRHSVYSVNDLTIDQACPPLAQELYAALLDYSRDNKKMDKPACRTHTARWCNEFERLKSNLRFADSLSGQIATLSQSINVYDEKILSLIRAVLEQDKNAFQKAFDAAWYVKKYPDIDSPMVDPYQHFAHYGILEGRTPSGDLATFVRAGLLDRLKELNAQINQEKLLLEAQSLELAQREQTYAHQMQDILQVHEQQKREQSRQYAEREQDLLEQLALSRQQIEAQSLELAQREKTYAQQLCALTQRWAEAEKAQVQTLARLHVGLKAMSATLLQTPLNANNRLVNSPLTHTSTSATTLDELLSYYDEHFIHSAFHILLGRAPDPEGLRYYLERVRAGISKVEILAQLRLSVEGKSREVKIAGLKEAIRAHQRQKKSILGALFRLAGGKADKSAQNLRAIENKFYMINYKLQQQFSEMDRGFCQFEKLFQNQERTQELINKQIALSQKSQSVSLGLSGSAGSAIKVSVIILTKNPGQIFKEVLLAALGQETPWPYEVLVVDSGSSDGTIDFLRQHPSVRLLEVKSSEFGHGRTRNFAVSMAKGQYAAMLTHDAKPLDSNWLFNLVRPLDGDPAVAGVFGRHKAYPEHSPYIKRDMELHFNGFLQWPAVMGIEDPERYAREQGYRQVLHFFSDNNACLRKEVWERIPYPDVNFAEDQLWAKAIIEAGYKRAYADDAVVYHSHDYSIKDTFRRSFDESRALKSLFGYDLCPSARHGFTQIYAGAKSDLKFLSGSAGLGNAFGLALRTPLLHIAKQSGWYVGRYQGRLKGVLFWLFSLDGAKKRKTNMTFIDKWKSLFSSNKRDSNQPQITETTQQAAVVNKTDVIGFYDFVITEDAGTLPEGADAFDDMTINWFIPDFGIGSGGHLNIFRFIGMLEKKGYKNTICVVGSHRHSSPLQARNMISEHFFALQADVVFGAENLPAARYSFATSWTTAYALKGFGSTLHKLYFVQDFEPAFYPKGSEYDFAEETYKFGFTGVCAGDWLARTLEFNYGMKCHSIGFSYDRELYQQTVRRESQKQRVFCYCRPPTVRRGWESAMLALSLVGQKLPEVEFVFAGWDMGNYHFPYPHLNGGVCSLKELPDLYSQCDVALVFSFTNLSLLPLELMACGCVVVSNRAPNTEWLLNDSNSILPESSSPRAIADAIVNILGDTERRVKLAEDAKVFASSTSWEVEGERLAKILIDLDK